MTGSEIFDRGWPAGQWTGRFPAIGSEEHPIRAESHRSMGTTSETLAPNSVLVTAPFRCVPSGHERRHPVLDQGHRDAQARSPPRRSREARAALPDDERDRLALLRAFLLHGATSRTIELAGRACNRRLRSRDRHSLHRRLAKETLQGEAGIEGSGLDQGLWRYSRHPNYFGDLLVYVGWALFAANPRAWLSPATNLAQYAFDAIPKNEEWAADRYGQAWTDYAARTSRLMLWPPHRPEATSDDYTEPR